MNKKVQSLSLTIAIILLICVSLFGNGQTDKPPDLSEPVQVIRIIDGDTIEVSGDITVRMIGIDTPESVHPDESRNTKYGKIASEYTEMLLKGKSVQLEYDTQAADSYGRTLAYVYADGQMINEILLRNGIARAMVIPPNTKYADHFCELEQEARENNIGFWADYFSTTE
ncbi:MAG: thermonuclease family protein [Lachnospiraceae bacterium]|nr:thermonuclease family protein [Lachnospiraceae bacterium]